MVPQENVVWTLCPGRRPPFGSDEAGLFWTILLRTVLFEV